LITEKPEVEKLFAKMHYEWHRGQLLVENLLDCIHICISAELDILTSTTDTAPPNILAIIAIMYGQPKAIPYILIRKWYKKGCH